VRFGGVVGALVAASLLALAAPSVSSALEPPNQNDPCSSGGRDTCGTTGVGFYRTYRYGVRWFGDYRGAVPNAPHTFCLDLGYWYPAARHEFREETSGVLRNRAGEAVSAVDQQKLAYAIWAYGRTTDANQQAAVMLYVHSLMGDARPGEVDPDAIGPGVASNYAKVAADAARYHGPYRIVATLPDSLVVTKSASATIRVLSAAGNALPGLELGLTARGATGLPSRVKTDADGVARLTFTAASADFELTVATEPVASTLPRVFAPTTPLAARNGQRLAVPSSQVVSHAFSGNASRAKLTATTTAVPASLAAGGTSQDHLTIAGAPAGYSGTVAVRIYGPFRSRGEVSCDGTAVFRTSFSAKGSGTFTTPAATLTAPGLYTYQETIPSDASAIGLTTPCGVGSESFLVQAAPALQTTVSSQTIAAGTSITDTVEVSGLSGEHVTVQAALYGPYPSRDAVSCSGEPVWTGSLDVPTDGEYHSDPFSPTVPGFYTYRETIAAGDFVRAAQSSCADVAETTVLSGQPKVVTTAGSQRTKPGAALNDRIEVTGLGALSVPVRAELWGPFATRGGITCTGTPFWTGTVVAEGDGTYTTPSVKVEKAGWYAYRESIAAGPATSGFTAPCAETSETTLVEAAPSLTTLVSGALVRPGSVLYDRIRVTGLGRTAAAIEVELHGPFGLREAITCSGKPVWSGRVTAQGDGVFRSPGVRVARAGFYTFRERLLGSANVAAATTPCALVPETALAIPGIVTGRGDRAAAVRATRADAFTPTRVQIADLGIDAPVTPVGIDVVHGVLAAPSAIQRLGWWRDGAAPGTRSGVVLIAGHVDSAKAGAGAFFRLKDARPGERIRVTAAGGRTFTYRVVSVRKYPKSKLPTDVYSTTGRARLILVTCGGPFDRAAGHYRDNVVLVAFPA
jgi:hypothetical protein